MSMLLAIPVYNEARHIHRVLDEVRRYATDILVINDGSTDETAQILRSIPDIHTVSHTRNSGYGAALSTSFAWALQRQYDTLVTMDCDGQHEPSRIPVLLEALDGVDVASGSRYLRDFRQDNAAPTDRRYINATITQELNDRWGLDITDAFCGFKAYRVDALRKLCITETGWGMPLQLWVQAARQRLRVREVGVPRLYLDPTRAFGGAMNDGSARLAYYREVISAASEQHLPGMPLVTAGSSCPEMNW